MNLLHQYIQIQTKNKIALLDSCHSGGFALDCVPAIDINETVEHFAGRGFAILASCGAEQFSGFNEDRQISLYTSFVCDALTSRFLIRKGKKSLEAINEAIFHFSELSNKKGEHNFQQENIIFSSLYFVQVLEELSFLMLRNTILIKSQKFTKNVIII